LWADVFQRRADSFLFPWHRYDGDGGVEGLGDATLRTGNSVLLAVDELDAQPGESILDPCAAPIQLSANRVIV